MRVLMFGWEYPPHNSGGLGVACAGITRSLSKNGVSVLFVLPKKLKPNDGHADFLALDVTESLRTSPIEFIGLDTALVPYDTVDSYYLRRMGLPEDLYGSSLFAEVLRYGQLARAVAEQNHFDVIHAHDWLSIPAGIEAKRVSGKPLIVHIHATGFDQGGGQHCDSRVYAIEKKGMEHADVVVAVSNYTKEMIVRKYGVNPGKIEVVHNGIDWKPVKVRVEHTPRLPFEKHGRKMVLFVGRLTIQKGADHFLRAAARVVQYEPSTMFVVAGAGDMEHQLIREAASLGLTNNILFVGFQRGEELNALYRDADLFVLPSVSEPFGLTALEAVAHGAPVLLSKQSGVKEVMTNALLVDFWDVDEMTNKMVSALRFSPLRTELSKSGMKQLSGITWNKAAQVLKSLYERVRNLLQYA